MLSSEDRFGSRCLPYPSLVLQQCVPQPAVQGGKARFAECAASHRKRLGSCSATAAAPFNTFHVQRGLPVPLRWRSAHAVLQLSGSTFLLRLPRQRAVVHNESHGHKGAGLRFIGGRSCVSASQRLVPLQPVRRLTLPSSGPAYGRPLKSNVRRHPIQHVFTPTLSLRTPAR